jgi:hypothetical protein
MGVATVKGLGWIGFFLAIGCGGCEHSASSVAHEVTLARVEHIAAPTGISSTPLFGCSIANFAWGREFYGFLIDDAGRVWSFNHGKTWSPKLAHAAGAFTVGGDWFERAPLLSMYSPAESSARLPAPVVAKYRALIEPARLRKITRARMAVDAGSHG